MANGHLPAPKHHQLAPSAFETHDAFLECGGVWTYCAEPRENYWPPHERALMQIVIPGEGSRCDINCRYKNETVESLYPKQGDVVIIPAGTEQEIHWRRRAPLIVLAAEPAFFRDMAGYDLATATLHRLTEYSDHAPVVGVVAASLLSHAPKKNPKLRRLIAAKGAALFHSILRAHTKTNGHATAGTESLYAQVRARVDRYIRSHLSEPFSLGKLAAAAHMSRWHFCRVMKKETTFSPRDYFNRCRVNRAYQLLATGKYTQTQVMHELGFSELGHFRRVFRKHLNIEPRQVLAAHARK